MKRKFLFLIGIFLFILSVCCFYMFYYFDKNPINLILDDVSYNEGVFKISVENSGTNSYCAVVPSTFDESKISSDSWVKFVNNKCEYKVEKLGNYSIFVKNNFGIDKFDVDKNFYFSVAKSKFYLAKGDKEKLKIDSLNVGSGSYKIKSLNEKVVKVKDNVMTGVSNGTTKVIVSNDVEKK